MPTEQPFIHAAGDATIELARPGDEPELRRLMREIAMPGQITLAFEREPDFHAAVGIEGARSDILVARVKDRLVALASHATRPCFVDGEVRDLGYLSMLRVERPWRGQQLTRAGFQLVRELMERDGAPFCISTIIADNARARAALEQPRDGFPTFSPRERLCTLASPTWRRRPPPKGITVRTAHTDDLDGIARCLQEAGRTRQFAPAWTREDLEDPVRTRGLSPEDFLVAEDADKIIGTVALWDQQAFKQSVVRGYDRLLGRFRRVVNIAAPLLNIPRLPPTGSAFPHGYLSHLSARDHDPEVTLALVLSAYERARSRQMSYVTTGLSERDPRLSLLRRHVGGMSYWSVLYGVFYGSRCEALEALDDRPAHTEVATL